MFTIDTGKITWPGNYVTWMQIMSDFTTGQSNALVITVAYNIFRKLCTVEGR
jgi:hypothetical protein